MRVGALFSSAIRSLRTDGRLPMRGLSRHPLRAAARQQVREPTGVGKSFFFLNNL